MKIGILNTKNVYSNFTSRKYNNPKLKNNNNSDKSAQVNSNKPKKKFTNILPYIALVGLVTSSCSINNASNDKAEVSIPEIPITEAVGEAKTLPEIYFEDENTASNNVEYLPKEEIFSSKYNEKVTYDMLRPEDYLIGKYWYDQLKEAGGIAYDKFPKLCSVLNMDEISTMSYLEYLCNDEKWGAQCTNPVLLCAQIYRESEYNDRTLGDDGLAFGLGQTHLEAVNQVNEENLKRDFDYDYYYHANCYFPKVALEVTALYMRYCFEQTGNIADALTMYNAGNNYKNAGRVYVDSVLEKLDNYTI